MLSHKPFHRLIGGSFQGVSELASEHAVHPACRPVENGPKIGGNAGLFSVSIPILYLGLDSETGSTGFGLEFCPKPPRILKKSSSDCPYLTKVRGRWGGAGYSTGPESTKEPENSCGKACNGLDSTGKECVP